MIWYKDIIDAGFKSEFVTDKNYFDQHGFEYEIITKKLSKRIYLDFQKETKTIELIRVNKEGWIQRRRKVHSLAEMKSIIEFFTDKP